MSLSIAIAVALTNAVIGILFTMAAGWAYMAILGIHDKDGGGSMTLFFVLAPIAALVGFVWGFIATGITGASEWPQFWRTLGLSQLLPNAAVLIIAVGAMLGRPTPLRIHGHALMLEAEAMLPDTLYRQVLQQDGHLHASLMTSTYDGHFMDVDQDRIHVSDGLCVIPLKGSMHTISAQRMIVLGLVDGASLVLDMPLRERPTEADLQWTEPMPMRWEGDQVGGLTHFAASMRYRVVKDLDRP